MIALVSLALQIVAGVFTRRGVFLPAAAPVLEALLTAIIAAAVATFGHEAVSNYGRHKY